MKIWQKRCGNPLLRNSNYWKRQKFLREWEMEEVKSAIDLDLKRKCKLSTTAMATGTTQWCWLERQTLSLGRMNTTLSS